MVQWTLLLTAFGIVAEGVVIHGQEPLRVKVTDFGAEGDGVTDNTEFFKAAFDKVAESGGGTVVLPPGVFRSGPLRLVSGLTLLLKSGAVLQAIDEFERYALIDPLPSYGTGREGSATVRREAFLSGDKLTGVKIIGEGNSTIDGAGLKWWEWRFLPANAPNRTTPWDNITLPHLVEFRNSRKLEIRHLFLQNSPLWHLHLFACSKIQVRNLEIRVTPQRWSENARKTFARPRKDYCGNIDMDFKPYNTDGIVPDSCTDVFIDNYVYDGGDDAIAIKSGWDCYGEKFHRPTKDVTIRNVRVRFTRASALAIGSEMSGGVENLHVKDLRVECSSLNPIMIKTAIHRGGYVRNVRIENLTVGNVSKVFSVVGRVGAWLPTPNPACLNGSGVPEARPPLIEGISIQNATQIPGTWVDSYPIEVGQEGLTIRDFVVRHLHLKASRPGLCLNAEGEISDINFKVTEPDQLPPEAAVGHNLPSEGQQCVLA
mmetsp:Transcript_53203/g.149934  ORF Transcript_53203/g.149934 Transcript_53203/m.149934 type:complete len:485 (-) Transcript_53203:73-1527(-)